MKRNFPSLPANSHRGEGVRERENGGGGCLLTYSWDHGDLHNHGGDSLFLKDRSCITPKLRLKKAFSRKVTNLFETG